VCHSLKDFHPASDGFHPTQNVVFFDLGKNNKSVVLLNNRLVAHTAHNTALQQVDTSYLRMKRKRIIFENRLREIDIVKKPTCSKAATVIGHFKRRHKKQ